MSVWIYSNQREYDGLYADFLKWRDIVNDIAGDYSGPAFNNLQEMLDAYDGYALNMEVDFERPEKD